MSVYTTVNALQLEQLLRQYQFGQLCQYSGIQDGIENTNYSIETTTGHYILTIYEELNVSEIESVFALLQHLFRQHYPAPVVQIDSQGSTLTLCQQKPAAFFQRLSGQSVMHPNKHQFRQLGIKLAQLHHIGKKTSFKKQNRGNLHGCQIIFQHLFDRLSSEDVEMISNEISFQTHEQAADLPSGLIHADLFRDNVLFCGNEITGILDFYTACQDTFILDLAIACNDWCKFNDCFDSSKMNVLLNGYQEIRKLSRQEQKLFPVYLRFAALRFWLSRLHHNAFPVAGEITRQKDPAVFRGILQQHILNPVQL